MGEGVAPTTINQELALLKHMLTKAAKWGYLKNNPAKPVKLLKEPPGGLRYVEAEELDRFLDSCNDDPQVPYLGPIVMMALHTGMRLGKILGFRWDDFNLKRRLSTIPKTKNNARNPIQIKDVIDVIYEEMSRLPRHTYLADRPLVP